MLKQALITAIRCLAFVSSNFVSLLGLRSSYVLSVTTPGWLMFVVHDFSTRFDPDSGGTSEPVSIRRTGDNV